MKRSPVRTALTLLIVSAFIVISVASSATLATPAPNQLVWRFPGQNDFERQGTTIHDAGDVNDDGVQDIIVGLHTVETAASGNHISARVYSGKDGSLLMSVGAPVTPYSQSHPSFNSVASLGDLTGDGHSEFVVGTPGAQVSTYEGTGIVRIVNGDTGAILATKFILFWGGQFGASVAAAGDVDADGVMDLIVGAPGAGSVSIYSGDKETNFMLLATLQGDVEGERFGGSVGTAGDIDEDGRSEVVVGVPYYASAGGHGGRVQVFKARTGSAAIYIIDGTGPTDLLGTDVDGGRDLNDDDVPDFLASALGTDVSGPLGTGYVKTFSGKDGSELRTVTSSKLGDLFGFSAELSDSCDDKNPTLVVGAPQAVNPANSKVTGRVVAYNAATGAQLTEIYGEALLDGMGISVGGFVDLTDDGKAEFVVGAHGMSDSPALWTNGSGLVYSCVNIPRPDIVADPNPANLGNVTVGTVQELIVQIRNLGDATLDVSSVGMAAGSNPAFGFGSLPEPPFSIPPAGSQSVTIEYSPTAMGIHGGALQIGSNDPDDPTYDVTLMGRGVQRTIQVTPASAAFGAVDVDDMSWAVIEAQNVGNTPLTVSSIALASGSASDFTLSGLPSLPQSLGPSEKLNFFVIYEPTAGGAHTGAVEIDSNDPDHPTTVVPLSGTGVPPNLPPTAVIRMDVPYSGTTIQFRGGDSFDPDGTIASYYWEFGHDGQTSALMDPEHVFYCAGGEACLFVVRLTVTDNGGKSDPTSVTAVISQRASRSRFYGTIQQGDRDVRDGTVVEAWIDDVLVAESLTQSHLGRSVFAIEIPPDVHSTGEGGEDGDTVVFKYNGATADQTGTWYRATDQELNLTAPYLFTAGTGDWCLHPVDESVWFCGPATIVPEPEGLIIDLQEVPVPPIPDPGPWSRVGMAFELTMLDAHTGEELTTLSDFYQIGMSYTDGQLAAAGVTDEGSLGMCYIDGSQWTLAGSDELDALANEIVTTLDHTSIFALMSMGPHKLYLPIIARQVEP